MARHIVCLTFDFDAITFHPFVIGRGGRMLILERLNRRLKDEGTIFTTLETAAAEYERRVAFKDYSRVTSAAT